MGVMLGRQISVSSYACSSVTLCHLTCFGGFRTFAVLQNRFLTECKEQQSLFMLVRDMFWIFCFFQQRKRARTNYRKPIHEVFTRVFSCLILGHCGSENISYFLVDVLLWRLSTFVHVSITTVYVKAVASFCLACSCCLL